MDVQDLNQLSMDIADAKKAVKLGDALERLYKNRDFKLLINETFLKSELIALVQQLGNPMLPDERRKHYEEMVSSIGKFSYYLNEIEFAGQESKAALLELEEE